MTDVPPEKLRVEPGMLLAAWPNLLDPNFMHKVVLMCDHTEQSAFGLVVNDLLGLRLGDLFPEHPALSESDVPVYRGGPVDVNSLHFIHTVPEAFPGCHTINRELAMGGDLSALARFVTEEEDVESRLRVFIGYSGWGAGQLEGELAGRSWVPAPPSVAFTFGEPGEGTWRRVIRSMDLDDLSSQPPDPTWN